MSLSQLRKKVLDGEVEVVKIKEIVKCSRSLVLRVANIKNDGGVLFGKAGRGGQNLKSYPEFLSSLE
uniref:Uncharacterized protein n=1 Tax=Lepeophtheirus salmonis TaxID=72036 RepID=A0A0K2THI5_LEPSM